MRGTMTGKILEDHLVSGKLEAGSEIVAPDANTFLQYLKHTQKS